MIPVVLAPPRHPYWAGQAGAPDFGGVERARCAAAPRQPWPWRA